MYFVSSFFPSLFCGRVIYRDPVVCRDRQTESSSVTRHSEVFVDNLAVLIGALLVYNIAPVLSIDQNQELEAVCFLLRFCAVGSC
jgi:hypothetical protein